MKYRPHPLSPLQGESLQGEPLSTNVERGKSKIRRTGGEVKGIKA